MKRVYSVDINIKRTMLVVADDESHAQRVAAECLFAFLDDDPIIDDEGVVGEDVQEITEPNDAIPYGPNDDDPERDWTVKDWLEKQRVG